MSHTPDDLAEESGWPRLRVLTAMEAGLSVSRPDTVYLVVTDEAEGQQFVIGIRRRTTRAAQPDD